MTSSYYKDDYLEAMRKTAFAALGYGASPEEVRQNINQAIDAYRDKVAEIEQYLPTNEPRCPHCGGFGRIDNPVQISQHVDVVSEQPKETT